MSDKDLFYDAEEIWEDLTRHGFSDEDIESTLAYIERTHLKIPGPYWSAAFPVPRSHSPIEVCNMSSKARGYLWILKSRGILDHVLEEEIIQKVMNLGRRVRVQDIKTVAALTIFGYEHRGSRGLGEGSGGISLH